MTHDRVEEAMHAVDCGCDGGCGYPYREMARTALDTLDLPARDRHVKAQALREFADLVDSRYPTDIWPELEPDETPFTIDRIGASMGRVVARQARREADEIETDQ